MTGRLRRAARPSCFFHEAEDACSTAQKTTETLPVLRALWARAALQACIRGSSGLIEDALFPLGADEE